jgi:hypothetical protein
MDEAIEGSSDFRLSYVSLVSIALRLDDARAQLFQRHARKKKVHHRPTSPLPKSLPHTGPAHCNRLLRLIRPSDRPGAREPGALGARLCRHGDPNFYAGGGEKTYLHKLPISLSCVPCQSGIFPLRCPPAASAWAAWLGEDCEEDQYCWVSQPYSLRC